MPGRGAGTSRRRREVAAGERKVYHAPVGIMTPRACLAAMVFVAWGCESGPELAQPSTFTQRDSAGIAISVTPGEAAGASLGWRVDPDPDLIFSAPDFPGQ